MLSWLRRHWRGVVGGAGAVALAWWLVQRRQRSGGRRARLPSATPPTPVDDEEAGGLFARATQHVGSGVVALSEEQQLRFYGLYKQATVGPAPSEAQAGLWDYVARAKWGAWSALGAMDKAEARRGYIALLDSVAPNWAPPQSPRSPALGSPTASQPTPASSGGNSNNATPARGPAWHRVSVMAPEPTAPPLPAEQQDFLFHVKEGNVDQALQLLERSPGVLEDADEDGATGLLWAVDRGNVELVRRLLEAGADVERADADGSTALHYACMCGHAELVELLLSPSVGARPDSADHQGVKPADVTDDPAILAMLQRAGTAAATQ